MRLVVCEIKCTIQASILKKSYKSPRRFVINPYKY